MDPHEVIVLWREGAWRCEFHGGSAGNSRLLVYHAKRVATAESAPSGHPAFQRAEILRQRVRRGDLKVAEQD